jgi:hypothetical protein
MAEITPDEVEALRDGIERFLAVSRGRKLAFIAQLRGADGLNEMADLFVRIMTEQEAAAGLEQSQEAAGAA